MPQTSEAERAEMSASSINDLPDSAFAYIEPGGKKDDQGKTTPRDKRHFPIHDEAHVRNALSRAPQSPFGDKAMPKIKAAAKKFGIGDDNQPGRAETLMVPDIFWRSFPLEDIRILKRSDGLEYGDGRTVEAVVAVFDAAAEVQDQQGHYTEIINRGAFDRAIDHARPQGARANWLVSVYYNHGLDAYGTPSRTMETPIGTPLDIHADARALITTTRYNQTPAAEIALELIRSGAATGHSFTGRFNKSDPVRPPRGGYRSSARGELATVRRLELGLKEYGPTPNPVYTQTEILSVRSLMDLPVAHDEDLDRDSADSGAPEAGLAPDDLLAEDEHSSRDDISRAALMRKIASARRTRPGLARPEGVGQ